MKKVLYILGEFEDDDIEWLAKAGRKVGIPTGQALIREGEPIDSVYFVTHGTFTVSTAVGGEVARVGAGEVLGEISYVDRRPPTATVTAAEQSGVIAIPCTLLSAKLAQDAGFAARFYRALAVFLADRLRSTLRQLGQDAGDGSDDELDLGALDTVSKAGVRFERIIQRLQEV
jgi:CRP-like cAMP-binding protein